MRAMSRPLAYATVGTAGASEYEGELRQYQPTEVERRYYPAIDPRKTYNLAGLIDIAAQ
jgi:hypothetical protein